MQNLSKIGLVSLAVLMTFSPSLGFAAGHSDLKTLAEGNNTFALELYEKLKRAKGNLFFSPYSISTALAMTYAGARENTAEQMAETLRFVLDDRRLHSAFAELIARLNAVQEKGHVRLSVANSLWPQKGYPFREEYLVLTREYYGVSITAVDYVAAREAARKMINEWVEENTRHKIRNLIQRGVLDALTRLVLVNAIYFKGNWASQFAKRDTQNALFHLAQGKSVGVPMMKQKQKFGYARHPDLRILELPYVGNDLSMLVLLPEKVGGLPELENLVSAENLEKWMKALRKREVAVFLPRFKMTSQFRLDKTLASMGMPDAFNSARANFTGMDGNPNWLCIGAVIHKAFVEVNEEGTEAAAATAVVMKAGAMPGAPPVFRADHPFLFLIRDNITGSLLFMGRVVDPTAEGK